MSYDLVLGKSPYVKDNPIIIGSIEYEEYPLICKILKKSNHQVFNKLADMYSDAKFTRDELEQAQQILFDMMLSGLEKGLKDFVYKLISVISFALKSDMVLYGVAD